MARPGFRQLQTLADDLEMPSVNWSAKFLRSSERSEWRNAVRKAQEAADKHPQMGRVWFTLGYTQIRADRADAAAESFQKALELGYRKPTTLYNLACSYAKLNQKDRAFDYLFQALDAGFDGNGTLRNDDDDLDNLRGDPRFRKARRRPADHDVRGLAATVRSRTRSEAGPAAHILGPTIAASSSASALTTVAETAPT